MRFLKLGDLLLASYFIAGRVTRLVTTEKKTAAELKNAGFCLFKEAGHRPPRLREVSLPGIGVGGAGAREQRGAGCGDVQPSASAANRGEVGPVS